jgi:hypothetical protein
MDTQESIGSAFLSSGVKPLGPKEALFAQKLRIVQEPGRLDRSPAERIANRLPYGDLPLGREGGGRHVLTFVVIPYLRYYLEPAPATLGVMGRILAKITGFG